MCSRRFGNGGDQCFGDTPTNATVDGQSLLSVLQTNNLTLSRYGYSELFARITTGNVSGRALRNTQFKLIAFTSGTTEFLRLNSDPYEKTNLVNTAMSATQLGNYYSLVMKLGDYQIALSPPSITGLARSNAQFIVTCSAISPTATASGARRHSTA